MTMPSLYQISNAATKYTKQQETIKLTPGRNHLSIQDIMAQTVNTTGIKRQLVQVLKAYFLWIDNKVELLLAMIGRRQELRMQTQREELKHPKPIKIKIKRAFNTEQLKLRH